MSRFFIYLAGIVSGLVLAIMLVGLLIIKLPAWLVVESVPINADVSVVLGGGGGSRLRAAVSLYDSGGVSHLVLVDRSKQDWTYIVEHLCPDCQLGNKDVVYLEGSTNTFTDAVLSSDYLSGSDIKQIVVVTDPYHSRRALLIFQAQFDGSGIDVSVMNSGDFVDNVRPDEQWWRNDQTSKVILLETTKIIGFYLREYF